MEMLRKFRFIAAAATFVAVFVVARSGLRGYATAFLLGLVACGLLHSVGLYLTTDNAKRWVRLGAILIAVVVFVAVGGVPFTGQTATEVLGEEQVAPVRLTVQAWVAERVETPVSVKHATVQADGDVPGVPKRVVKHAHPALHPTPTATPLGYVAPATPTPTPEPGQVVGTVEELYSSGLLQPIAGEIQLQLVLEPEGKGAGESSSAGECGRVAFCGG